jgi:predicted O-methyltransferase YrrM
MTKKDLTAIFPSPFWLAETEIPYLAKQAATARDTIVEIGCAYGGSTTVFLLNKPPSAHVYSIDPFVPDSGGSFRANERDCRLAVKTTLDRVKKSNLINDWTLICDYSYNVFQKWNKKIDLLFIDGSHLYDDVKRDFEQWSNHLSTNGVILLHDSCKDNLQEDPQDNVFSCGWAGPTKLVNEISSKPNFKINERVYSITSIKTEI